MTKLFQLYKFAVLFGSEPLDTNARINALVKYGLEGGHFEMLAMALPDDEFVEFIVQAAAWNFEKNLSQELGEISAKVDYMARHIPAPK